MLVLSVLGDTIIMEARTQGALHRIGKWSEPMSSDVTYLDHHVRKSTAVTRDRNNTDFLLVAYAGKVKKKSEISE
jgi:hypothetical protein